MRTIWRDYGELYADILGEFDDLWFCRSGADGSSEVLICWEPYLNAIMSGIAPDRTGWSSLAREYHLGEGFKDGDWALHDVSAAVNQLRSADRVHVANTPFGEVALIVLADLILFLEQAHAEGKAVAVGSA